MMPFAFTNPEKKSAFSAAKFWRILGVMILSAFAFPSAGQAASKPYAEWCQCAIFVVNHLGLEIIPGDYYTAGSFVIPDAAGKTWMEYQGFDLRGADDLPENGDVIVIRPNGRVYFPEDETEGSRLVTVNVDAWAGHIGVIASAEAIEWQGKAYWRLTFLSSNWGVHASPMFVRSGCFNVDRSDMLIEKDDPDVSFWRQTNVPLQRQHILNIARQLAFGYYHVGIDGTADGYPISGEGLLGYAWNVDWQPEQDFAAMLAGNAQPIPLASLQAGDALVSSGETGAAFTGLFAGWDQTAPGGGLKDWYERGTAYGFDMATGTLQGPHRIKDWLTGDQAKDLLAYRSTAINPLLEVDGFESHQGKDGMTTVGFILRNQGGKTLNIESAGVLITTPQGGQIRPGDELAVGGIEIPAGQEFLFSEELRVEKNGVYIVQPLVTVDGKPRAFPEQGSVVYVEADAD